MSRAATTTADSVSGPRGYQPRPWVERLGIPRPLAWGYLGLLLFMIGDGVELGYLSPYLIEEGMSGPRVALLFTVYGISAGIAAWFSGALSDLWGPRQVMLLGFGIWVVFQVLFLTIAVPSLNYPLLMVSYGLRGFGYPLFAFGFLVWIAAATAQKNLGTSVGWFWFAFTGGLPTLGALVASALVPQIGPYATLWASLGLVVIGGLIALSLVKERTGMRRLAPAEQHPIATLLGSITILARKPRIGIGSIVRTINTAPMYGYFVFLPIFFTETIGFSLEEWLRLLTVMFATNIFFNLFFGVVGDKFGWRKTVTWFGGVGCAVTTLLLYYVPNAAGDNYALALLVAAAYGATLAGYVPLSALMPSMAPQNKGQAMAALNLGAGASVMVGPAIVGLFLGPLGVAGVMWIYAVLYVASAVMALFLKLPREVEAEAVAERAGESPLGSFAYLAGNSLLGHPVALRTPAGEDDIDLVLFDIGGTVYDDNCYAQALLAAVREIAGDVDEKEFWEFYDLQREEGGEALRVAFARRYLPDGDAQRLHALILQHWDYPTKALYPDVLPTLTALRDRYKLGLLANSPSQVRDALARDGVTDLVDVVVLGGVDAPEKPDPGAFRQAMTAAGVSAGRTVYVGNRLDTDVRGSLRAGLRSVWMLRGEAPPAPTQDQLNEPDAVITSLTGLPMALARLASSSSARVPVSR